MTEEPVKPKIEWRINEWFSDIEKTIQDQLYSYFYELIRFNKKINLISSRTVYTADEVHFADSILGSQLIFKDCQSDEIYDLGSGNGIPGMVMAILSPNIRFCFIDTDSRKIEFLKFAIGRLGLKNAEAKVCLVESLPSGSIKCAVSRGFASISKATVLTRGCMAPGAEYYHFKGSSWMKEVAEIPSQICAHYTPSLLGEYSLPASGASLSIVKVTARV